MSSSSNDLCKSVIFTRKKKIEVSNFDTSSLAGELVISGNVRNGVVQGDDFISSRRGSNCITKEGHY